MAGKLAHLPAIYLDTFLIFLSILCLNIIQNIIKEKGMSAVPSTQLWIRPHDDKCLNYFCVSLSWIYHFHSNYRLIFSFLRKQYWSCFKLKLNFPSISPLTIHDVFAFVLWGTITWYFVYNTLIFFNYFGPSDWIKKKKKTCRLSFVSYRSHY